METRTDWIPARLVDQLAMMMNIQAKLATYVAVLPITTAQRDRILLICLEFINVYNYVELSRATTLSLGEWRDLAFRGTPTGADLPDAPPYTVFSLGPGYFIGIMAEFRQLIEMIKRAPGYTRSIGEDLMIVGTSHTDAPEDAVAPVLKVSTHIGYEVHLSGSMQGMDALRAQWQPNGSSTWTGVAFLTRLPGEFILTPTTPGAPESGRLRFIFIKNIVDFGNFSAEYAITIS